MGARRLEPERHATVGGPAGCATVEVDWNPRHQSKAQWKSVSEAIGRVIRTLGTHGGFSGGDIINITVADKPARLKGREVWRYHVNLWRCQ